MSLKKKVTRIVACIKLFILKKNYKLSDFILIGFKTHLKNKIIKI